MSKSRIGAVVILIIAILLAWGLYASEKATGDGFLAGFKFKLGLDLRGGTQLIYQADVSAIESSEVKNAMEGLRDVIERRVNLFGVSEPVVQVEETGALSGTSGEQRLIVELPGVTNVDQAVKLLGETPLLEFKLLLPVEGTTTQQLVDTGLTGRFLKKAQLQFDQSGGFSGSPSVVLEFNEEGSDLFAKITRENVGKILAIYLDNAPISTPVINEEITGGNAVITGQFTSEEGKILVGRLNSGALPVPIELISTQKIGATLGSQAVDRGVFAGLIGFIIVALFLILWYRLPGLLAVVALCVYVVLMLVLFKLIPVTLTAAGIAGFILSIGMAVDANILIFERMKEELKKNESIDQAMHEGFSRAWPSIRDSNISSMITAVVLFWFGTSLVKGFALTFGIGVLISMFTAITATRMFLYALGRKTFLSQSSAKIKFLFSSGLSK
ncbi:MAG TPA: protein translocase subunit SecD [Candidatus Paceibacterota bacterium]